MDRIDGTCPDGQGIAWHDGFDSLTPSRQTLRIIYSLALHWKRGTENYALRILCETNIRSVYRQRTLFHFWNRCCNFKNQCHYFESAQFYNHPRWHLDLNHPEIIVGMSRFMSLISSNCHCISRSSPWHVIICSLTCKHRFQHVMVRSLACHYPFLSMSWSVPLHVLIGSNV